MAVDIRSIEIALVKTVRKYIGAKLSTIGEGANEKPSVIRSRLFSTGTGTTTPTFPDYPYASVDYTRITDEGYELTKRTFDADGNYVYTTHKLASYSIKFFGTSQNDVMSLANEMHMLFEVDQVRAYVTNNSATEARVRSKSDIVFVATNMEDKYREIASFDVILAVLDQTVLPADPNNLPTDIYNSIVPDTEAEYIENIEMDTEIPIDGVQGGLYIEGEEDPELHIDVNTNITNP